MKIIYHTPIWQAPWENCILTLGTFDGLHKGHLKLIKKAISIGHSEKLPIVLLTYSPSPKSLLFPENYEQIYTQYEKQEMLKTLSINYVVVFSISKQTLEISAQYYLKNVIMKSLRPKHIVIGRNHTFGRNRRGNARYLTKAQKKYNFLLHIVNHKRPFREKSFIILLKKSIETRRTI